MAAKSVRDNPLEIRILPIYVPRKVTKQQYIEGLQKVLREGDLPEDWNVDIAWRNPATQNGRSKDWQQGEFIEVLTASSSGFTTAVGEILEQAAAAAGVEKAKRSAAAKKGAQTRKIQAERTKAQAAAWKRSQAARKGAATRKANARRAKKGGKKKR